MPKRSGEDGILIDGALWNVCWIFSLGKSAAYKKHLQADNGTPPIMVTSDVRLIFNSLLLMTQRLEQISDNGILFGGVFGSY